MDRLDFVKIENFNVSKLLIRKVKIQPIQWDEIFANGISDKGIVSRI